MKMSDVLTPGYIYVLVEREFVRSGEPIVKVGRTRDVVRRLAQYPKGSKLLFSMYCDSLVATETEVLLLLDKAFNRRADIGRESFEGDIKSIISLVSSYATAKLLGGRPACPAALVGRDGDAGGGTQEAPSAIGDVDVEGGALATSEPTADLEAMEGGGGVNEEMPGAETSEADPVVVQAPSLPVKEAVVADVAVVRFVEEHKESLDNAREVSASLYDRFSSFCDASNWKVPVKHEKFSKLLVQIYGAHSVVVRDGLVVNRYVQMPRLVPVPDEADAVAENHEILADTNKLHDFLAMDEVARGCRITRVEGHVTWELDFQKLFEGAMGIEYAADTAVFTQFGFTRGSKTEFACLGCKQVAKARGGKCCDAYVRESRRLKIMIHNMCIRQ